MDDVLAVAVIHAADNLAEDATRFRLSDEAPIVDVFEEVTAISQLQNEDDAVPRVNGIKESDLLRRAR